ncbi:MAG: exodeoxyribonuclease VII small subunit [Muribaculaceae bacterium]
MEQQSYKQAIAELEAILKNLRSESCDVDTLTASTRRAVQLLNFCRERLTTTEAELNQVLATLQSPEK